MSEKAKKPGAGPGYSGQEFDSNQRAIDQALRKDSRGEHPTEAPAPEADIPPDNGRRAFFDKKTGAVHGSGTGAGGDNPGEDFDNDSATGDGHLPSGAKKA